MADVKKTKTKTASKTSKSAPRPQGKPSAARAPKAKADARAESPSKLQKAKKTAAPAAASATRTKAAAPAKAAPKAKAQKTEKSVERKAAATKTAAAKAETTRSSAGATGKGRETKAAKAPEPKKRVASTAAAVSSESAAAADQGRHKGHASDKGRGVHGAERSQTGAGERKKGASAPSIVTVVTGFEDVVEDDSDHPLAEMIAVTETESTTVAETIERDGRIVAADFQILNLHEGVKQALRRVKYHKPTEVQALCLPHTLEGKDVAGFAQTGTGKTAVFLITAAHRLLSEELKSGDKGAPAVLVLVPTRELAAQIEAEAATIFADLNITTMAVYGGSADIDKQTRALSKKVDVVVATPGRLFDLHRQGAISFESVGLLVCDEADRMLDMGFIDDVEKVLSMVSETSQKMFFSATGSEKVHELAFEYLNNPEYIETTPEQITPERITQWCYAVRAEEKFQVLLASIRRENPTCAIVFTNTKVVAEWVGYKLACNGLEAEALTGDIPQNRRMALIKQIKEGQLKVLVATDVLSRGLHVPGLSHVYNFDVPDEAESFIHRIGRTARAGEKGSAITLVCEDYGYNMGAVEDLLGFAVPVRPIESDVSQIEDKSDFPFDSTGRVKSTRDVREGGGLKAAEKSPEAFSEAPRRSADDAPRRSAEAPRRSTEDERFPQDRPQRHDRPQRPERAEPSARHDRGDRPERTDRTERGDRSERFDRPERGERTEGFGRTDRQPPMAAAAAASPSDRGGAPFRDRESRPETPVREPRPTAAGPSDRGGAPFRGDDRPMSDQRQVRESREPREPRPENRPLRDRLESQPPRDVAADARGEKSRESKFVRRDERAKEVIEAALLAAARERELLRLSSLKSGLTAEPKLLTTAVASGAISKLGQGLVKTIRTAAPGLGSFLRRLGSLLDEAVDNVTNENPASAEVPSEPRRSAPPSGTARTITRDDQPSPRREAYQEQPRREQPRREQPRREQPRREQPRREQPHREEPSASAPRGGFRDPGTADSSRPHRQHQPARGPAPVNDRIRFEREEVEPVEEPLAEVVFEQDGSPLREDYNETTGFEQESVRSRAPGAEDGRPSRGHGDRPYGRGRDSHGGPRHQGNRRNFGDKRRY